MFNTSGQLEGEWFPDVEGPWLFSLEKNVQLRLWSALQEHHVDFQEGNCCRAEVLVPLLVIPSLQSHAVLPVRAD